MMARKRKRRNSDKSSSHLPNVVKDSIKAMFQRQFVYKFETLQLLPKSSTLQREWTIPVHLEMKDELNMLKNNLNDKNMLTWHDHTRAVNIAGNIAPQIRAKFRPELCTQAWCKFYEIASVYLQVDPNMLFYSVHLCEAPGAFVTSLNQYLLSIGYQGHWDWLATTLNPYYEGNSIGQMIDDDRFIHCSHGNWYFGPDGTGNLMSRENLTGLLHKLQDVKVDLVTADGSIDCQGDPAEQENVVSRLHYCEVITALHILSKSGTLVVKMFTLFECRSISLMYILNCVFETVNVFKPCTSKGGNSEVYVICKVYNGKESCESYLSWLTEIYFGNEEPEGCILAQSDIPQTFFSQHSQCMEFFKDCQMTSIQRNLDLYKVRTEVERSQLDQEREYCMEYFLSTYNIETMVNKARIMKPARWNRPCRSDGVRPIIYSGEKTDRVKLEGKFTGSFQERLLQTQLPWKQKVLHFETYEAEVDKEDNSLWIKSMLGPLKEGEVGMFAVQKGKRVDKIRSSRFCHNYYIAKTNEIIDNSQWLKTQVQTSPEFIETVIKQLVTVLKVALGNSSHGKQDKLLNQSTPENGKQSTELENQSTNSETDCVLPRQENNEFVNQSKNGKYESSCKDYLESDNSHAIGEGDDRHAGILKVDCDNTNAESDDQCETEVVQSELNEKETNSKEIDIGSELARHQLKLGQLRTNEIVDQENSKPVCENLKDIEKISKETPVSTDKDMETSCGKNIDDIKYSSTRSHSDGSTTEVLKEQDDMPISEKTDIDMSHSNDNVSNDIEMDTTNKRTDFDRKTISDSNKDCSEANNGIPHSNGNVSNDIEIDTANKETEFDRKAFTESAKDCSEADNDMSVDKDEVENTLVDVDKTDGELLECELRFRCDDGHSQFCQQLRNKTKGTGDIVRFYTVFKSYDGCGVELSEPGDLCQVVMEIIKTCCLDDSVVIELGTSLCRITAGLVYILYRSFSEVGFMHYHGNLLKRHLVCTSYQYCPISLHQCLAEACHQLDQDGPEAVLELLPIYTLLDDADFTSFLHISNTNLLQSFITTVINKERQLCME